MPLFVLNPYLWLATSAVLIGVGFVAASGWGTWGRR
jgi:hypothetical protein